METLINSIDSIVSLTAEDKLIIQKLFSPVSLSKNQFWIKQGQYCNDIVFIESGKFRIYYEDEEGNEVTCYFLGANQFASSFTSFLTHTPTMENIIAIEETNIFSISRDTLEYLSELIPKIHIWRRIITENLFILMEKRVAMLQSQSAHERYELFLRENPEILLSVPLQYTASFLGITPQHLSRLRKQLIEKDRINRL